MKRLLLMTGLLLTVYGASFVVGCTAVNRPPQIPPAHVYPLEAWTAECVALWQDELLRPMRNDEVDRCLNARKSGFTIEMLRTELRASDDYAQAHRLSVQALHTVGRHLIREDGTTFLWRGITSFRLLQMLVMNQEADAEAYLSWCAQHNVTVVRVLASAWNLFRLDPPAARAVLPQLLAMAARHGVYVEVVALADTANYPYSWEGQVREIGSICAVAPNCLVELANEPVHQTQDPRVADPAYLQRLRKLIPANVLVSLGSTHGADADGDTRFAGGDYVTIHEDRANGDNGWRWVRHRNDSRALGEQLGKFLVGDEPRRDDLDPDKHFAFAALARMYGMGDTFHYLGGLGSLIPTGNELAAFEARSRGWDSVEPEWRGRYSNVGQAGNPILDADWSSVLKVYSSLDDDLGYTLSVGGVNPQLQWSLGWSHEEVHHEGGAWLWRVRR